MQDFELKIDVPRDMQYAFNSILSADILYGGVSTFGSVAFGNKCKNLLLKNNLYCVNCFFIRQLLCTAQSEF